MPEELELEELEGGDGGQDPPPLQMPPPFVHSLIRWITQIGTELFTRT